MQNIGIFSFPQNIGCEPEIQENIENIGLP